MQTFQTSQGHRLTYSTMGQPENPPIIMIHGWFSHRGVWETTMQHYAEHHYCIAIDLLGFGESNKPSTNEYTIEAQAKRVLELIDNLGFDQFILVGHSMGGMISLYIAAELAPDRVIKVVSVAGVVTNRLHRRVEWLAYPLVALTYYAPIVGRITNYLSQYRWAAHSVFRSWFYKMDNPPFDTWAKDRWYATNDQMSNSGYWAGQAIHHMDLTDRLKQIKAPTLAIFGKQDGTVHVSDGRLVDEQVPDSSLALIDQCGHFPMYEQPDAYLRAMGEFITP